MDSEVDSDPTVTFLAVVAVAVSRARWLSVLSSGCCLLETHCFLYSFIILLDPKPPYGMQSVE
jgi:hypothetical protein